MGGKGAEKTSTGEVVQGTSTAEERTGGGSGPRRGMWDPWGRWAVIRSDSGGQAAIRLAGGLRQIQGHHLEKHRYLARRYRTNRIGNIDGKVRLAPLDEKEGSRRTSPDQKGHEPEG